jgi:hypothetical protein
MGKRTPGHGASDDLAAIGELLAALVEALAGGTPEEISALARILESKASSINLPASDAARLAAIATVRTRAALLVETLFATTDCFLSEAIAVQARSQGYRPRAGAWRTVGDLTGEIGIRANGARSGLAELRA